MGMFSKILRRSHMYLALFLTPWVLMYTLSTFVMNHRTWFAKGQPGWTHESDAKFAGTFPDGSPPREKARIILASLGMEGTFNLQNQAGPDRIQFVRQFAVQERRFTFAPESGKVTIEKRELRPNFVLERFHRRRGYQQPYATDWVWAVSVDLVVAAIVFWALSGLWMWWELKVTRRWGAAFLVGGLVLFQIFLRTT
jgi:hypothetical protein